MMTFQELLRSAELSPMSYSGRGMMGKRCLAVVTKSQGKLFSSVLTAIVDQGLSPADINDYAEAFESMRSDSMGHDIVFYFPTVEFDEDEDEDSFEGDD